MERSRKMYSFAVGRGSTSIFEELWAFHRIYVEKKELLDRKLAFQM